MLKESDIKKEFARLEKTSLIFSSFVNSLNNGFVLISNDFHVLEVNPKICKWFPQINFSIRPLCYRTFFKDKDSPCPECPLVTGVEEEASTEYIAGIQKDERVFSYKPRRVLLDSKQDSPVGVMSFVEDITAKVKKERTLFDLELKYMQMVEDAGDAIITVNRQWQILRVNKKAKDLFGYSVKEFNSKKLFSLIPEGLRKQQEEAAQKIFSEGRQTETSPGLEGTCIKKDGTAFSVEMTFSLNLTGDAETVTFIIRDISSRKKE